jgi:hypothetical protein
MIATQPAPADRLTQALALAADAGTLATVLPRCFAGSLLQKSRRRSLYDGRRDQAQYEMAITALRGLSSIKGIRLEEVSAKITV